MKHKYWVKFTTEVEASSLHRALEWARVKAADAQFEPCQYEVREQAEDGTAHLCLVETT